MAMHRLEPVWAFFALLGTYTPAVIAAAASVTVVIVEAHDVLLPIVGMICACATLFYIRRKLPLASRAFYALASFFAGLPWVWAVFEIAKVFWPVLTPSALMPIGFLAVMLGLPFVLLLRAGTKLIEDHPQEVLDWLWRRLPKEWRGGRDADQS